MIVSFIIPNEGELLLKESQKVDFQTPLLKKNSKNEVEVPLARILKINPKDIFQYLQKFVGEEVKKGDIIAEHKTLLRKKRYRSEYEGIFKEINHNEGTIIIETIKDEKDIQPAFFSGEIHGIIDKNSEHWEIKLKVEQGKEFELKEATKSFGGEAVYERPLMELTEDEVKDKIVIANKIPGYEQTKYEALSAKGFVCLHSLTDPAEVPFAKLKNISDYEEIMKADYPYCIIDSNNNTIYFYH